VLSQSSFIAPHVRSSMKSCPSWKMSRDRDALLLAGVYKHGYVSCELSTYYGFTRFRVLRAAGRCFVFENARWILCSPRF
jgi:hypothetical protein